MKPDPSKLRQQTREHAEHTLQQSQQKQTALEFATAEEMIREDAAHTPVPPQIAERLNESIAREPKPAVSWWRRLFSRSQ
ncbi:MAG: hypothetical protein FJ398_24315 [Verrucomicrobia bacterium]|nr:hypothetical protein [Verrucomicrobiota bacterium]